jgi:hypothetical protein
MLAVNFFTVETIWLQRLYVLFFIELGSRLVQITGMHAKSEAPLVTPQARQLMWTLAERRAVCIKKCVSIHPYVRIRPLFRSSHDPRASSCLT